MFAKDFFQSLKTQTLKPDEIILVDSSDMADRTLGIAQQYISNMKVFFTHPFSVGAQRWVGIQQSSGDIIVFTDLDAVLYPDGFEKLVEKFNDDSVNIVRGSVLYKEIRNKIPHRLTRIHHCNTAYRRKVLDEFPFDEKCVHDDRDMNERVGKKYEIYGAPLAKVFHIGSFEKTSIKEKVRRYADVDLYLARKYKSLWMYFRPIINDLICLTEFRFKWAIYHFWFYLRGLV
jgi:glycosyltransferase involved in cell wall biosynthesis